MDCGKCNKIRFSDKKISMNRAYCQTTGQYVDDCVQKSTSPPWCPLTKILDPVIQKIAENNIPKTCTYCTDKIERDGMHLCFYHSARDWLQQYPSEVEINIEVTHNVAGGTRPMWCPKTEEKWND